MGRAKAALTRSAQMARIRDRDTVPEMLLRRELWARGVRYRLRAKLPGRPDLMFKRARLLVFVDGCFWHGCPEHYVPPKTHSDYWHPKIENNAARDRANELLLREQGWTILRFWEHEVEANASDCARRVVDTVRRLRY